MENSNTILNELKKIAPSIAEVGKQNLYETPDFFFDSFASEILKKVHSPLIEALKNPYQTPVGYFDGLHANYT